MKGMGEGGSGPITVAAFHAVKFFQDQRLSIEDAGVEKGRADHQNARQHKLFLKFHDILDDVEISQRSIVSCLISFVY